MRMRLPLLCMTFGMLVLCLPASQARAQFSDPSAEPTRRSTMQARFVHPQAQKSQSSSLKTWNALIAPAPTRSSRKPPLNTILHGSVMIFPELPWLEFQAAVNACWFDMKLKKIGVDTETRFSGTSRISPP